MSKESEVKQKYLDIFGDNDVLNSDDIRAKIGVSQSVAYLVLKKLVYDGELYVKKIGGINHYSKDKNAVESIKGNPELLYDYIVENGESELLEIEKHFGWTRTVLNNAYTLHQHKSPLIRSRSERGRVSIRLGEIGEVVDAENKVYLVEKRGHRRFKKYKDHSTKKIDEALEMVSEILGQSYTSKDPELFNLKLRHRIDTMPREYWLEDVTIDAFIKDIDLTKLPRHIRTIGREMPQVYL